MSINFPGPNGPIRLTGPIAAFLRRSQTGGTPPPAADLAAGAQSAKEYLARLVRPEYVSLPFRGPHDLDNWTGETWEIRRAYRALLLKEPAVKAALKSKVAAVASLAPQVLPEDKASPRDRAAAAFVDWAIGRSHGGWPGVIRAVAAGALIDGFSVCEKVLAPTTARAWPGFWGLDELAPLDTRYIRLDVDPYKRVTAVRYVKGQAAQAFDPRDFTVYAYQALWGSPFGISELRAAYRPAVLIEAAVRLRAVLLENFAGPFLVGTYQAGDQGQKEELLAVLREARATGYVAVPDGDEVTVLNLATSADAQFGAAIADYRKEIYTAVRGAYLPFSEGAAGARVGNSQVHQDTTDLDAWDLAVDVAEVLNRQLIPDLVRPNFGDGVGLPRVTLGRRDPDAALKTLEIVKAVQAAGVPVSAGYIYAASGVEPPRGPDDVAGGGAGGPPPADRAFAETPFDESKHPRDDRGRWVSKDAIQDAARNPEAAGRLREQVTDAGERRKMDDRIREAAGAPKAEYYDVYAAGVLGRTPEGSAADGPAELETEAGKKFREMFGYLVAAARDPGKGNWRFARDLLLELEKQGIQIRFDSGTWVFRDSKWDGDTLVVNEKLSAADALKELLAQVSAHQGLSRALESKPDYLAENVKNLWANIPKTAADLERVGSAILLVEGLGGTVVNGVFALRRLPGAVRAMARGSEAAPVAGPQAVIRVAEATPHAGVKPPLQAEPIAPRSNNPGGQRPHQGSGGTKESPPAPGEARTAGKVATKDATPISAAEIDSLAAGLGDLGGKPLSQDRLRLLRNQLAERKIILEPVATSDPHAASKLSPGERAKFRIRIDKATGVPQEEATIYFRPGVTGYDLQHELFHASHARKITYAEYVKLAKSNQLETEQFVYDQMVRPKVWNQLTPAERQHATDYIYHYHHGDARGKIPSAQNPFANP